MAEKKKVIVKINGQDYSVISEESEEYIKHIAKYVDSKAKEIYENNKRLSQSMVAMLTAFTITDEYYKTYQELDDLKNSIIEPFKELEKLREESKKNNETISKLKDENEKLKIDNNKLKENELINNNKIKKYEETLKIKDKELETNQKIITQLQNKLFETQIELVQLKKEIDELMKVYDK